MTARRFAASLLVGGACTLLAAAGVADTTDTLSTDVKRLEVRTDSCEAIGLEFESRLSELAARLADAAEAGAQRSDAQREEIAETKVQMDALDDCAADLELFRDQVAERLGEPPAADDEADAASEEGDVDSLQSLHLRHDIITSRIERLREMARMIRESLTPSISRAGLDEP